MPIDRRRILELSTLAPRVAVAANTRRASMVQLNGYAVNAEAPLDLLTDYLTPNHWFFVGSHWVPHPPDVHGWTLSVDGDVATAMQLTGSDLRGMPVTEVTCVVRRRPLAVDR